jgi:tight adherence protein C
LVIGIIGLGGIALLIFGLLRLIRPSDIVSQRMQIYAGDHEKVPPAKEKGHRIAPRELSGSLFSRTIKPFVQKIIAFFGKNTPAKSIDQLNFDLRAAGNPYGMHAREFYGVRVLLLFISIGLAILLFYPNGFTNAELLYLLLFMLIALYFPRLWLRSKIRQRQNELSHNLPDALDMLSVCATAGLSFDQGLQKICDYWPTALNDEFKQVLQEMEMGVPRVEALRNLRTRVNVDDLSSFIAIIIQAENIGMSIAAILQSQAKQMRIIRQFRAKEKANTLPAKMMIPVGFFIFPALMAVILGPLIPVLIQSFR